MDLESHCSVFEFSNFAVAIKDVKFFNDIGKSSPISTLGILERKHKICSLYFQSMIHFLK